MTTWHFMAGFTFCVLTGCSSTSFKSDDKKSVTPDTAKSADAATPSTATSSSTPDTNTGVDVADKAGTNAVTKGSFTAWTIPASPKQFEPYKIVIRVTVPSSIAGYTASDLSGSLVGTDDYHQNLQKSFDNYGFSSAPQFKKDSTYAYLGIMVPGAESKVQDNIQIHSALLNESQSLTLLFQ